MRGDTYFERADGLLVLCRNSGKKIIKTVVNNTDSVKTYYCENIKKDLLADTATNCEKFELQPCSVKIFVVETK